MIKKFKQEEKYCENVDIFSEKSESEQNELFRIFCRENQLENEFSEILGKSIEKEYSSYYMFDFQSIGCYFSVKNESKFFIENKDKIIDYLLINYGGGELTGLDAVSFAARRNVSKKELDAAMDIANESGWELRGELIQKALYNLGAQFYFYTVC